MTMQRLTNLSDEVVQAQRNAVLASIAATNWAQQYQDEADWPTREVLVEGSNLELYDDVHCASDGESYRVISPAGGRDRVQVVGMTGWGLTVTALAVSEIDDRAPVNPHTPPMPIMVEEPTP